MKRHAKCIKPVVVKKPKYKRIPPLNDTNHNEYVLCYVKETVYVKPLAGYNTKDFEAEAAQANFDIINTPFGPGRVVKKASETRQYGFVRAQDKGKTNRPDVIFQGMEMDKIIPNGPIAIKSGKTPILEPAYMLETETIPGQKKHRAIAARRDEPYNLRTGYFYPAGNDKELSQMIKNFTGTIKKHKIKCNLDQTFAEPYAPGAHMNYGDIVEMVGMSYNQGVDLVIWLGPPPSEKVIEGRFARAIHRVFNKGKLPLQYIPFESVPKQYKYLDMLLDFAFLRA